MCVSDRAERLIFPSQVEASSMSVCEKLLIDVCVAGGEEKVCLRKQIIEL